MSKYIRLIGSRMKTNEELEEVINILFNYYYFF